ncbi:MAG: oxidoreductase [Rhodobacteraceae bacterium]|nr:MAG: oxidoreductase [Paracoccaceae bacterium]
MAQLSGKHALITGAAGGIGAATAHLFVDEGADVTLLDRDQGALDRLVAEFPAGRATAICCDVTDTSQMKAAFDSAPRLDVIVLNAGIAGEVAPITEQDESNFDQVMAVNVKGTWLGLKYGVAALADTKGSIIVTSSVAGLRGIARSSAYSASKHAVLGLVKSVAAEVGGTGLRINAVCPSPVDTNMMRSLEEGAAPGASAKAKAAFERMMLLRRYGAPEEIANMMLFLASDASSYCTGSVFTVDGGYTAT